MNYKSRLPYHPAYQIENAVNEGGGSLCYAISGLLCWFQVSPALTHRQSASLFLGNALSFGTTCPHNAQDNDKWHMQLLCIDLLFSMSSENTILGASRFLLRIMSTRMI